MAIPLPKHVAKLTAYSSAKSEKITGTTWLNANESPYDDARTVALKGLNRYPDPQPEGVLSRYSQYAGVTQNQVMMTRGADEGIELLVRTYCEPGVDAITIFAPTYGMYKVTAESNNVALNVQSQADLTEKSAAEIAKSTAGSRLVFVCNPNNPTGALLPKARIAEIQSALSDEQILVVDEAYIEFAADESSAALISKGNVAVLRTLSKAFAMAGLRSGFLIASDTLLAPIRKVIAPYPIPGVVASIVEDALSDDGINTMRARVRTLNELKAALFDWLKSSPAIDEVHPSAGNFILCRVTDASMLKNARDMGLILRPFVLWDNNRYVRISIGSSEELSEVNRWLASIASDNQKGIA